MEKLIEKTLCLLVVTLYNVNKPNSHLLHSRNYKLIIKYLSSLYNELDKSKQKNTQF